jgi:hypothetical protein
LRGSVGRAAGTIIETLIDGEESMERRAWRGEHGEESMEKREWRGEHGEYRV